MQILSLLTLAASVHGAHYYLSERKFLKPSSKACDGGHPAMATDANLEEMGHVLDDGHVKTAFVGGWNGHQVVGFRINKEDETITVNPNDQVDKRFRVMCTRDDGAKWQAPKKHHKRSKKCSTSTKSKPLRKVITLRSSSKKRVHRHSESE